ncbi:MAG: AI-2E family transporter [Saprospiraceae bacterium]|nr:AI-2E family transporter [Saprospiraceae bacterium]
MEASIKIPFYIKFAGLVIGATAIIMTLYLGEYLIVPLIFALLFAILLDPVIEFLSRRGFNRTIAITLVVVIIVLIGLFVLYLIFAQFTLFYDSYPLLSNKFQTLSVNWVQWISSQFKIKIEIINAWIYKTQMEALSNLGGSIGYTVELINSFLFIMILLPVYLFLILYYKGFFIEFMKRLFIRRNQEDVFEFLGNSKNIIQKYLVGLLLEALIVAVLNSIGLYIIGIEYAVILGISGAILNIIPYLGGVLSTIIPVTIALVTKDSYTYALEVVGVYLVIQLIDNNFIVPRIVASRVQLNALVSIVVVLLGGALWGIPGMFLSIPMTAILKVGLDHVDSLKAWGYLLGNKVNPKTN